MRNIGAGEMELQEQLRQQAPAAVSLEQSEAYLNFISSLDSELTKTPTVIPLACL